MAKILIIEDDLLIARLYKKAFSLEGYEIEIAYGGEEGLAKIKSFKPDLVLLDIMMPKMNGFQVMDALRANPETKKIPVTILTNLAGEKDAETGLAKGAVKYIIKSEYEPREVVNMVKEVLRGYTHEKSEPS